MRRAWLVSRYPALSHSFIRREVQALRRRGHEILTFSLRTPDERELVTAADRDERATTWYVLPAPLLALLRDHLAALGRAPLRYCATLAAAFATATASPRAVVWRLFYFAEAIRLAAELRRRGIAHLHVHFADSGAEVGRLAARFLGIPWSLTLHGFADLSASAERFLVRAGGDATHWVAISDFMAARLAALAGRRAPPITVVRCGLDFTALAPPEASRPATAGRPLQLLAVGRLAPEKAFDVLLDALARARAQGLAAELTLVGAGPEQARLAAQRTRLALDGCVRFAGALGEADLDRAYRGADLVVLASRMEGIPVVLMEALARGVPVVATRVGGVAELVEHETHGLLVPADAPDELAAALLRLARDDALRARCAAAGPARVRALHDVDTNVAALMRAVTR